MFETKPKFFENYDLRYSILLTFQLAFLLIFRFLTLFISTENLHHIPFITFPQLLLISTVIEFVFCLFFLAKILSSIQEKVIFFCIVLIYVFLAILYIEQYFIATDTLTFLPNDMIFVYFQVIIFIVLIALNSQNLIKDIKDLYGNRLVILFISFILLMFAGLTFDNQNLTNLFLFLANFIFWIFLIVIIVKYANVLNSEGKWFVIVPIVIGFFLGFGMFMGMTQSQVMKLVILTIIDQTISLYAIQPLIYGVSVELAMIFLDVVLGFIFGCVLLVAYIKKPSMRREITINFILGVTGLGVYPLLALIRFFALFRSIKEIET